MEYATIAAFRRDPVKVWEFYALRFELLTTAEPNEGHRALAELERRGLVAAVVTQNIDGLPERAGSREVAHRAGLLLVVGSSLEVQPVAGLPGETVSAGGALAIVNRGPTPFDHLASIRIDGGAGETLMALAEMLA
jgi:NAD-dependent deacetylase